MIKNSKCKSGAMHAGTCRHYALAALAAHQHKQSDERVPNVISDTAARLTTVPLHLIWTSRRMTKRSMRRKRRRSRRRLALIWKLNNSTQQRVAAL